MRKYSALALILSAAFTACFTPPNAANPRPTPRGRNLVLEPERTSEFPDCLGGTGKVALAEYTYLRNRGALASEDYSLRAYVFYPSKGANETPPKILPVVAMFHGGGWIGGSPTAYFPMARYLASRGMVAVTFQYRLHEVFGTTPRESVEDAQSAVSWLRKYATELGVNPQRVTALGDSAGGHLALTTALLPDANLKFSSQPQSIVAFYPVVETGPLPPLPGGVKFPLSLPDISPVQLLESWRELPPTLMFHGTKDDHPWAPYEKSKKFCDRANELEPKHPCRLISYPDRKHGFLNTVADYDSMLAEVDAFLVSQGALPKANGDVKEVEAHADIACRDILSTYDMTREKWGYGSPTSSRWGTEARP